MTTELSWLSGTLQGDPKVIGYRLSRYLDRAPILPAGRVNWEGRWYRQSLRIGGVKLAWEPRAYSNTPTEILVDVPQRVLQDLGTARSLALLTRLRALGLRPTRVDVAINDPFRHATGATARSAFRRGDIKGHLRRGEAYETLIRGERSAHAPSVPSAHLTRSGDFASTTATRCMELAALAGSCRPESARLCGLPSSSWPPPSPW